MLLLQPSRAAGCAAGGARGSLLAKLSERAWRVQIREDGRGDVLDAMYSKWPFFKVTMDMMAMVLAKGDEATLSLYEAKLVEPELHPVGEELRGSFRKARQAVLSIVGDESVLGSGATLHCAELTHAQHRRSGAGSRHPVQCDHAGFGMCATGARAVQGSGACPLRSCRRS